MPSVRSIPCERALELPREGVVGVAEEIMQKADENGYPEDQTHEGPPYPTSTMVAEVIIPVDMTHGVNCDHLSYLP